MERLKARQFRRTQSAADGQSAAALNQLESAALQQLETNQWGHELRFSSWNQLLLKRNGQETRRRPAKKRGRRSMKRCVWLLLPLASTPCTYMNSTHIRGIGCTRCALLLKLLLLMNSWLIVRFTVYVMNECVQGCIGVFVQVSLWLCAFRSTLEHVSHHNSHVPRVTCIYDSVLAAVYTTVTGSHTLTHTLGLHTLCLSLCPFR